MKRSAGRVYKFFLLIACIAVCAFSGCSPIGSIGGSSDTADLFWTDPKRYIYEVNDLFMRNSDLQVFTSYRGVLESIPLEKVTISIAEKPDLRNDLIRVPADENYPLKTAGMKLVVAEYEGMSDSYYIEVKDPFGLGGNGSGGEGGPGIEIEWETPVETD